MAVSTIDELVALLNLVDTDATVLAAIANDSATSVASGPGPGLVTTRLGSNVKNVQKLVADIEAALDIDGITAAAQAAADSAAADAIATAADRIQTGIDVGNAAADAVLTAADVVSSASSASTATTQAGIATTQATAASGSATTATTQAGIATTQAGNASTSASTATTQAGIATTQAGNAAASAAAAIVAKIEWQGPWVTSTVYALNDAVSINGSSYICIIAHTAGVFATDLSNLRWEILAQVGASGAGTGDLLASNNLSDLTNFTTARSNLGLGTAATTAATAYATSAQGTLAATSVQPTATQTLTNKTITGLILDGAVTEEVFAITGTTPAISATNGTIQTWALTGASTPTITLATGQAITLMIDDGTANLITWPTITWINNSGAAPTLAATGYTVISLWRVATIYYGALVGPAV
jgi:hypothetical protein